jgi:hypothetical protein
MCARQLPARVPDEQAASDVKAQPVRRHAAELLPAAALPDAVRKRAQAA